MEDEHVQDALVSRLCRAVIARVACTRAGPASPHGLLRHQRRIRQGRRPRRPRRRRPALPDARAGAPARANKTWRAYLSTQGAGAVNARDRIGHGPWANAKGVVIAKDVAELHGANNLTKQTALTEKGEVVNGRGDTPNMHDILTGSQPDGTAFAGADDRTCGNWTKSGAGRGDGRPFRPHGASTRARRRNPGTRRTPRAGRAAAAARTI